MGKYLHSKFKLRLSVSLQTRIKVRQEGNLEAIGGENKLKGSKITKQTQIKVATNNSSATKITPEMRPYHSS